jgi:hypothetical protein
MSIANELSSDIATAVFTRHEEKAETEAKGLTEIVLEVHTTLRRLTDAARRHRLSRIAPASPGASAAASGDH